MIDLSFSAEDYLYQAEHHKFYTTYGKVSEVVGLVIKAEGLSVFVGEICEVAVKGSDKVALAEVVGFVKETVLLMPLDELEGIGPGCIVKPTGKTLQVRVGPQLLGHTLDGLGRPFDDSDIDNDKLVDYPVIQDSPDPFRRKRISNVMPTGVRTIDGLLTVGEGQRMGIFAGSGVGKSTLLGMIARYCQADVIVIGLIGERGREVMEFIEKDLGKEGYAKSVVVCATSDTPPLVRLKGAHTATAIAEYFRDQGKKVVLMMDSVTRFAMAQREIGLSTGEPPTTKGYTPSVFAELPKLLERSGMSEGFDHCILYGAGRRRRHERADCRCRSRYLGRTHRSFKKNRFAKSLSGNRRPSQSESSDEGACFGRTYERCRRVARKHGRLQRFKGSDRYRGLQERVECSD